jgi:23S rRNA (uracil1939-C5)-methyltransferase
MEEPPAALFKTYGATALKPFEAERRDLFKAPLSAAELNRFDAGVFDPPRQGAQAQSRELAASSVPIVVAVSCNPGTFARDIRHLINGGYRLLSVTPVDQFCYSAHVEVVARLQLPAAYFQVMQQPLRQPDRSLLRREQREPVD